MSKGNAPRPCPPSGLQRGASRRPSPELRQWCNDGTTCTALWVGSVPYSSLQPRPGLRPAALLPSHDFWAGKRLGSPGRGCSINLEGCNDYVTPAHLRSGHLCKAHIAYVDLVPTLGLLGRQEPQLIRMIMAGTWSSLC